MSIRRVSRHGQDFTREEMIELARLIRNVETAHRAVLLAMNGRARVRWLDPLGTFGKAFNYFSKLRSALDDDWIASGFGDVVNDDGVRRLSPFYGATSSAPESYAQPVMNEVPE